MAAARFFCPVSPPFWFIPNGDERDNAPQNVGEGYASAYAACHKSPQKMKTRHARVAARRRRDRNGEARVKKVQSSR